MTVGVTNESHEIGVTFDEDLHIEYQHNVMIKIWNIGIYNGGLIKYWHSDIH